MTRTGAQRAASLGLVAVMVLWSSIWVSTERRLARIHRVPASPGSSFAGGDAERGRRLATGVALCSFCHGHDLGGRIVVDDPWLGSLYAPNLTSGRGGLGATRSDEELARAIRWGVDPAGRSLVLMPSEHLGQLTDRDLRDIIAFLRAAPAVSRRTPDRWMGPVTRLALVVGLAPELLAAERSLEAQPGRSGSHPRGAYLAAVGSCRVCHRDDLRGGLHPLATAGEPDPPDISGRGPIRDWSPSEFRMAMRSGRTPDGRHLDPVYMPWPHFAQLRDDEIDALFGYLRGSR